MSTQQHNVAICCSSTQQVFAKSLISQLQEQDITVYRNPICTAEAAVHSKVLLLLWDYSAQNDPEFQSLLTDALHKAQHIIPILRDDTPLLNHPSRFDRFGINLQDTLDAASYSNNLIGLFAIVRTRIKAHDQRQTVKEPFTCIPAGEFQPGSFYEAPPYLVDECQTQSPFNVNYDFYLARSPVLVHEYRYFIYDGGYSSENYWTKVGWRWRTISENSFPSKWNIQDDGQHENHPVEGVSFYEAVAYCKWLQLRLNNGINYRLPTETEWEKSAKGGILLESNQKNPLPHRVWPWGNHWNPMHANTSESNRYTTIKVFDHPPESASPYGILGLAGNLDEWCLNTKDDYPSINISLFEGAARRMVKGGNYTGTQINARCSARLQRKPEETLGMTLRLAYSL